MLLLIGAFLVLMLVGVPVAVSMAVSSLLYLVFYGVTPDIIAAQRMIAGVEKFSAARGAVLHLRRQPHEHCRRHRAHLFLRADARRLDEGRPRAGEHHRIGRYSPACRVRPLPMPPASVRSRSRLCATTAIPSRRRSASPPHPRRWPDFPPSLPFVIYGMMANVSIGALFMAGILPGVVMTALMMVPSRSSPIAAAGDRIRRSNCATRRRLAGGRSSSLSRCVYSWSRRDCRSMSPSASLWPS